MFSDFWEDKYSTKMRLWFGLKNVGLLSYFQDKLMKIKINHRVVFINTWFITSSTVSYLS